MNLRQFFGGFRRKQLIITTLKKFLVAQNLKIAESSVFIFSKIFVWHSLGENVKMKESN